MNKFELRFNDAQFQVDESGEMKVTGYVNKTGSLSNVLGATQKFQEKIAKGAFARAIRDRKKDIDFLAEHDNKKILSSTRNNSLILEEDEIGLRMEATITPTSWGKDYYELIRSGILQNMSFGFRAIKDTWEKMGANLYERTVEELELFEVSVVKDPAYSQSTISARGIDLVEEVEVPLELRKEDEEMEKILEILTSLEEKVSVLSDEFKAFRALKEEEKEEKEEQVDEQPSDEEEEVEPTDEPSDKEPEKTEDEEEEDRASEDEEEKEPEEVSDEKSENSEDSEESKEEVEEEEKEDKRSQELPDFSEFRNILSDLKK